MSELERGLAPQRSAGVEKSVKILKKHLDEGPEKWDLPHPRPSSRPRIFLRCILTDTLLSSTPWAGSRTLPTSTLLHSRRLGLTLGDNQTRRLILWIRSPSSKASLGSNTSEEVPLTHKTSRYLRRLATTALVTNHRYIRWGCPVWALRPVGWFLFDSSLLELRGKLNGLIRGSNLGLLKKLSVAKPTYNLGY